MEKLGLTNLNEPCKVEKKMWSTLKDIASNNNIEHM